MKVKMVRPGGLQIAWLSLCLSMLAGCGSGASSTGSASTNPPISPPSQTAPTSLAISGTPSTTVAVGAAYSFTPTVSGAAGALTFSIQNAPPWTVFSSTTGQLSGTPSASDAGTYSNITLSVSDGSSTKSLAPFSVTVTVAGTATTLATKYPGDIGIGADSSVVWYENFAEGSVAAVVGRYDSYTNSPGMSLVTDHPANSPGSHALDLNAGGSTPATDFYKSFGAGYAELFFRYYAKYVGTGPWHHTGLWIGGYNPPLSYPYPRAGQKPSGDDLFSIGLEPIPTFTNVPMDFYVYWMGMHSWKSAPTGAVGDYYGNTLLHNAEFRMQSNTWICYEIHLKINPDPTSGAGAVLEVWQNDSLIRRFDDSGPMGYWVLDKFCPADADGTECTAYRPASPTLALLDQQWRATSAMNINYFWPQNYNTETPNSDLILDDMVVATQRIGCTVPK
jgi:hypothetical protein